MKILFVCLGNICRSPMAEFVFKSKSDEFYASSAGTSGYHDGEDMHFMSAKILDAKKIPHKDFVSKKLTQKMCDEFDLILAMDKQNYADICQTFPNAKEKTKLLCDFCTLGYASVPDPWYTNNFDETYMIINNSCDNLIKFLKEKQK